MTMRAMGRMLVFLGLFLLAIAAINAGKEPNISYFVGTCLPGLVLIIIGLKLAQKRKTKVPPRSEDIGSDSPLLEVLPAPSSVHLDEKRANSFESKANW